MKAIFLLNYYYPYKNAGGVCVNELVKDLLARQDEVFVVCLSDKEGYHKQGNLHIYTIKVDTYLQINNTANKRRKRMLFWINYLIQYPIQNSWLPQKYCDVVERILNEFEIDIIIGVINPIESCISLLKIRKCFPSISLVAYELDSIADLDNRAGIFRSVFHYRRLLLESRTIKNVDGYIYMKCHMHHYADKKYNRFRRKMYLSDFPLFRPQMLKHDSFIRLNKQSVSFIFAGALIEGVRDPRPTISIMKSLSQRLQISCLFYSRGDYEDYIKAEAVINNCIVPKGYVTNTYLDKAMDDADVLISIGNEMPNMMPSKIYSYIAMRKPIIHFYSIPNDPCISILESYDSALLIDINQQTVISVNSIVSFLKEIDGRPISNFSENDFKYNCPTYTIRLLDTILSNN